MEDSLNTRILKRLGYFVAEAEGEREVFQLCYPDGRIYDQAVPESTEYQDLEGWLFMRARQVNPYPLFEGLRWQMDCYPNRPMGDYDYEVTIVEGYVGFGDANNLVDAMSAAWLDYMERKDRREQKKGKLDV